MGPLHEREVLEVSLTDEDGVTGYGEAAPLEPYDGISLTPRGAGTGALRPGGGGGGRDERSGNRGRMPSRRGSAGGLRGDRPGAVGSRGQTRGTGGGLADIRHAGQRRTGQRDAVGARPSRALPPKRPRRSPRASAA